MSRQHAWIRVSGGRCFLRDAGSRFGTFRNGIRVDGEIELARGEVFEIGQVSMRLEQNTNEQAVLSDEHRLVEEPSNEFRNLLTDDRRHDRLVQLLSEIGKTLIAIQPLGDVLNRVVDLVFTVIPAERAFLMLRESADEALTARVMRHRDGTVPASATLSRTVVKRVMREKVAIQAVDASTDAVLSVADSVVALHIRSFMCAPLWSHHDVIGVLYVDNPRTRRFSPEDLDILTAVANYAAVAIEQARLSEQLLNETRRRERLQRYHSPAVVNRIMRGGSAGEHTLEAQERDVTVMICDIVGFTTFSEGKKPAEVAATLNNFLTHMTDVVFEHEGTLDKYLGDALLAVFGAPFSHPQHALLAVRAALEMRRALATINEQSAEKLEMRIAMNSGIALTGDIGSPRRREFTVLGDVVNTASRIESDVAKPGQIVLSQSTWEHVKGRVRARSLGTVPIRGRTGSIEVFELEK